MSWPLERLTKSCPLCQPAESRVNEKHAFEISMDSMQNERAFRNYTDSLAQELSLERYLETLQNFCERF
jgi:hypothetical protein